MFLRSVSIGTRVAGSAWQVTPIASFDTVVSPIRSAMPNRAEAT